MTAKPLRTFDDWFYAGLVRVVDRDGVIWWTLPDRAASVAAADARDLPGLKAVLAKAA